jgi:hypothetical protein
MAMLSTNLRVLGRAALAAVLFLSVSNPALAKKAARWTATSTTSIAITGNIAVSADSIKFGNGKSIHIEPVGPDRPEVFRVDPPANPLLLNGNRLCGDEPPTFVSLFRDGGSLTLYVFEGAEAPSSPFGLVGVQPGMCASYHYER